MQSVLVVDDDPHIREVVVFALGRAGFRTTEASTGRDALQRIATEPPDLVVLDVMLPDVEGTEICREIRARSTLPIVFLTSRDDEVDRVVGLEIGGDDYVTKPFSPRELVARVRAVLRRLSPASNDAEASKVLAHGRLRLDIERFRAFWDAAEVVLTVTEFGILRTLLARPGKVYSRDELMTGAYGPETVVSDRTIDSHVRRVRAKFDAVGGDPIATVHGVGYTLAPCEPPT